MSGGYDDIDKEGYLPGGGFDSVDSLGMLESDDTQFIDAAPLSNDDMMGMSSGQGGGGGGGRGTPPLPQTPPPAITGVEQDDGPLSAQMSMMSIAGGADGFG